MTIFPIEESSMESKVVFLSQSVGEESEPNLHCGQIIFFLFRKVPEMTWKY